MQLTHLEHIEDNLMEHPDLVVTALEQMTEKSGKYSLKWDGAPALVFGKHPDHGRFFMGTKSVFNKQPKINYTVNDVMANHGDNSELASRLMYVFVALKRAYELANEWRVLQADLLFCRSDVQVISYNQCTFCPNTLTYQTVHNEVKEADIGLAIHTEYMRAAGSLELKDMTARPLGEPVVFDARVWLAPVSARANGYLHSCYAHNTASAMRKHDAIFVKEKIIDTELWSTYKVFYNSCIREQLMYESDHDVEHKAFTEWVIQRYANNMMKKKSHVGMKTQMYKLDEMLGLLHDPKVKEHLAMFSQARFHVLEAKRKIMKELRNSSSVYAYYEDEATDHEGYVMDVNGSLMKLVDRRQFSMRNFAKNGNNYKK